MESATWRRLARAGPRRVPGVPRLAHGVPCGRLCVLGSSYLFHDDWLDKDENGKLVDVLLRWLTGAEDVVMDPLDAEEPDVTEYHQLPDTEALGERVKCCLQERGPPRMPPC